MTEEKWFMACRQAKFIFYCHCVISSIWNIAFSTSSVLGKKIPRGALFAWLHAQNVYLGTTLIVTKTRPRSNYFSLLTFLNGNQWKWSDCPFECTWLFAIKVKDVTSFSTFESTFVRVLNIYVRNFEDGQPTYSIIQFSDGSTALERPIQAFKSSSLNYQVFK